MKYISGIYRNLIKAKFALAGKTPTFEMLFSEEEKNGFLLTKLEARKVHGYKFNIDKPRTLNEKMVHRRLHSRDPIWPIVTDKIGVRDWCERNTFGYDFSLPEIEGIYNHPNNIPGSVVGKPLVLKAAWASGYNIFLDDKSLTADFLRAKLRAWYEEIYQPYRLIWASHQIPRRFIIEKKFPLRQGRVPPDYKFFVIHGKVAFCQIDYDRFGTHTRAFLDWHGQKLDFSLTKPKFQGVINIDVASYEKMRGVAESVGRDFDFIRIDLYDLDGQIVLGELTQTPARGLGKFTPVDFDSHFGCQWNYNPLGKSYEGIL